jgi:hypothetical protein
VEREEGKKSELRLGTTNRPICLPSSYFVRISVDTQPKHSARASLAPAPMNAAVCVGAREEIERGHEKRREGRGMAHFGRRASVSAKETFGSSGGILEVAEPQSSVTSVTDFCAFSSVQFSAVHCSCLDAPRDTVLVLLEPCVSTLAEPKSKSGNSFAFSDIFGLARVAPSNKCAHCENLCPWNDVSEARRI